MNTPKEYLFTRQHAWANIKDDTAIVGISDELQEILQFINEIDLPKIGDEVEMDTECVTLNYDAGTYDLPSPLTGRVTKVNNELRYNSELIHSSCYKDGWLFEMEYDELDELEMLYSAEEYEDEIENMPDL
jgi:glycine cleavage system H protein